MELELNLHLEAGRVPNARGGPLQERKRPGPNLRPSQKQPAIGNICRNSEDKMTEDHRKIADKYSQLSQIIGRAM
jgi:hypothetical protein